jgi:ABC-type transport system involved in multi-copper enzyme maturation permease subunit
VLLVRGFANLPPAAVILVVAWICWFIPQVMPGFSTDAALRWGLFIVEGMLITTALVLTPAMLAGTLAGEKVRATLPLLLACQVSPREIVLGRLTGRLCVIGVLMLAALPALAAFLGLRGSSLTSLGLLVVLPAAVAFGGGGMALAASAIARRGRDALLAVYLLDLLLLLAPFFGAGLSAAAQQWLGPLNPYQGIVPLVESDDPWPALLTIGLYTFLGMAGTGCAAWRLRPAYLRESEGRARRWRLLRPRRVPPMKENPVLWKELYVEQVNAFNRFVRWLGILLMIIFFGSSVVLALLVGWGTWLQPDGSLVDWARNRLAGLGQASWAMSWLIQWSVGLCAAVAVASERERGTWDLLLVSPLEGREILLGKIWGSLYALRGFIGAVIIAWTLIAICGAMAPGEYCTLLAETIFISLFMVVAGVCFSLYCSSATRAMTLTIVGWMVSLVTITVLVGMILGLLAMLGMLLWVYWTASTTGFGGPGPPGWLGIGTLFWVGYVAGRLLLYGLFALWLVRYYRRHFDRLAGRSYPTPWAAVQRSVGPRRPKSPVPAPSKPR